MLYQLSYSRPFYKRQKKWWWMLDSNQRRRKPAGLQPAPFSHSGNSPSGKIIFNFGAGEGTRTPDRLITNQLLYQLSYASKVINQKDSRPVRGGCA